MSVLLVWETGGMLFVIVLLQTKNRDVLSINKNSFYYKGNDFVRAIIEKAMRRPPHEAACLAELHGRKSI